MKLIILAAGSGIRMGRETIDKPKCLVKYNNKPIINYILESAEKCNIREIAIVTGYKGRSIKDHLSKHKINYFENLDFKTTNMVYTLFKAENYMDSDIIVSYSDIIYNQTVLSKLIHCKEKFSLIVDKKWKSLWKIRMENILEDVETLKINKGEIIEIGKKPNNIGEVQGQYIGLFKISKAIINQVIDFYNSIDKNVLYDGNSFSEMYMTSFIQELINNNIIKAKPVFIEGNWLEIDTINDIENYKSNKIIF